MEPTWLQKLMKKSMQFLTQKYPFWEPKWSQNGAKMEPKIPEFRGHFGLPSQDAPREAKWRLRSSKMERQWSPKGANWRENGVPSEPKWNKKSMKNGRHRRCCSRLCCDGGSSSFLGNLAEIQVVVNFETQALPVPYAKQVRMNSG